MSGLESKVAENGGDAVAPPADVSTAMKVVVPNSDTISAAEALKLEGNALLAESKLVQAVGKYTAAIDLHPTAIYLSNRAFCYVKLEQFGLAILDADMALELDSTYVKAYYRRGSANMALAKFKLAVKDFRKARRQ
ncbi:unnamed protein product [Ectocarpus sp. 12 AP-2014]